MRGVWWRGGGVSRNQSMDLNVNVQTELPLANQGALLLILASRWSLLLKLSAE